MRFDWDPAKAAANLAKHGLSFELACEVWDDPLFVLLPDRVVDGEQRWHAIGLIGAMAIVLVVHGYPNPRDEDRVRIVSARKATAHERKRYEHDDP